MGWLKVGGILVGLVLYLYLMFMGAAIGLTWMNGIS